MENFFSNANEGVYVFLLPRNRSDSILFIDAIVKKNFLWKLEGNSSSNFIYFGKSVGLLVIGNLN